MQIHFFFIMFSWVLNHVMGSSSLLLLVSGALPIFLSSHGCTGFSFSYGFPFFGFSTHSGKVEVHFFGTVGASS